MIYETFHTVGDYSKRYAAVLTHFRNLPNSESAALRAARLAEEAALLAEEDSQ